MLLLPALFLSLFTYFVVFPTFRYYRDVKGLRKYPNLHWASGISDLPMILEAHRGWPSKKRLDAHKTHSILRIGPNSLSYSDAQAIKDIYGHGTSCTKDAYYELIAGTHASLFDVVDKPEHARKRKMMSSGYAIKNLEEWEHKVADIAGRLVKAFDTHCAASQLSSETEEGNFTIDYRLWTNLFTFAAISNIGLSENVGLIEQGGDLLESESMEGHVKKVPFRTCLFAGQWVTGNLMWSYRWFYLLKSAGNIFSSTYRRKSRLSKDFGGVVYRLANKRLERYHAGEQLDDLFSALMIDRNGEPNNLEWGEIVSEVSLMLNAGSDTTAIAISNTMHLLVTNAHCMKKLQEELDNVLDEDETVAPYDKVKYLPYLNACLNESLRMWPPISMGLPRRTPPEGTTIMDEFVPGNTTVSMSAYVVHHNPRIFPDPETYRPERWLGEAGKDFQSYFIAFSTGARGCIGRNISYLEQTVLLATVAHRYNFALSHPGWKPQRWEATTQGMKSLPLKIRRRNIGST